MTVEQDVHTCACRPSRPVGRQQRGRLEDRKVTASNREIKGGRVSIDEAQVLRRDLLGKEEEFFCDALLD